MNQLQKIPKTVISRNPIFTKAMKPPTEVYPLFLAVGVGLTASAVVGYSTMTREGSDVLVDKNKRKYYWDGVEQKQPERVSRNPFRWSNTRF
jgi:hypothetical protein